ncbi:GntR family transcriptional regulator [Crossiella cryophila]|uniref:GntR family transcriptional regulator n=2 Tax=Crossiella cryophila TaxID=43355 RepID=A0A7W7C7Y4_9PSEU|nr:GntR family transcriptional regulator [Crossiella cryophila]
MDRAAGMPAYRQLMHQVRDAVRLGWLRPGDRLPTVREVVATCGVNQNTVLKAYRELELAGLLEVRQGSGTFVRSTVESTATDLSPELRRQLEDWVRSAREAGLNDEDMRALLGAALTREDGGA